MPPSPSANGLSVAHSIILILIVVSAVAVLARRLRVPYTVALVLAGLGISLFGVHLRTEGAAEPPGGRPDVAGGV